MTAVAIDVRAPRRPAPAPKDGGVLLGVAAALVVVAVAVVLLFRLQGGSWFVVETPSMGTAAPVGSLIVDLPVRMQQLAVGDVVTFHPPTVPAETYSHRIVEIVGDGVRTRGDINGAEDGWVVHQRDLIGRAVVLLPDVGWLVRGLPILIAGALLTVAVTRWPAGPRRRVARVLGTSLSAAFAVAWLHPFANMVLLQTAMTRHVVVASVVGTGVLPIRVTAPGGASIRLEPGEVGLLRIVGVRAGHRIDLASTLDLQWWGWVLLVLICLTPLLVCVAVLDRHRMMRRRGGGTAP